ncbi:restriction endonuclease subunit S [Ectothiorhodospira variabilis]|uniref:restriction endonuclease subunit S n=1 Tax=Ectothiorhodospira variabilis TaxID=505694 RepID=UPI001EFB569F|nr:restriction endonuclease subunit S [Ectothiorhodospira variabilis]MCG5494656.1 restriction endonuclease subunit S [Ectothiorhodospira variabilis]MCG5503647.1 restriction endonuclease subunit S [Ectothiorhodospira variabilis]MCG5506638.1 restriction endonuclease subunit S [Ectothiorhodospira variabilis]
MFEVLPLGVLVEKQQGGGTPPRNEPSFWYGDIPWASVKDFKDDQLELLATEETITSLGLRSSTSSLVPPGTPMVCTRMAVGRCAVSPTPTAINQDIRALYPKKGVDPRYLLRVIASLQGKAESLSVGSTVKGIRSSDFLAIRVHVAPEKEQGTIARILDTLDTQIQKTEALIAKLEKVKEGLLHDLLTRGIDENGQLRPSPEQAPELYKESPLGLIPREWDALTIDKLSALVTSGSRGWAEYYSNSGDLFIRSQNVRMGFIDLTDQQYVVPPCDGEGQRTSVKPCDLLVTITGNSVGNIAHLSADWKRKAFVSQHVGLIRFFQPDLSKFAEIFLAKGAPGNEQLLDAQYGQSKPGLSLDNLKSLVIPIPAQKERDELVGMLESIKSYIFIEKTLLDKLITQKTGLMNDLLTGHVRVTPLLDQAQAQATTPA